MLTSLLALPLLLAAAPVDVRPATVDAAAAGRFADLALACVHKEYPNKISHVLNGDDDVRPARELTPAFFGCYDWHSSVHGHWLLARLARAFPDAPFAGPVETPSPGASRPNTSGRRPAIWKRRDA
jgi:hypothetical protein